MVKRWRGALALVFATSCLGWAGSVLAHGAPLSGRVTLDPGAPVAGGTLAVQVELMDGSAQPVTGGHADVTVYDADRQEVARADLAEQAGGIYVGTVQAPGAAGPYQLLLHAIAGASHWSASVDLTVAPAPAPEPAADPPAPAPEPAADPAAAADPVPAPDPVAPEPAPDPGAAADPAPGSEPVAVAPDRPAVATDPAPGAAPGGAVTTGWMAAPHLPSGPFPVPVWAAAAMLAALAADAGLRLRRRRTR